MPEPNTKKPEPEAKKRYNWLGYVVWPFFVVMVYLLSAGPVERHQGSVFTAYKGPGFFKFYAPLRWAYFHTPLQRPLGMYLHLWRPEIWDRRGKSLYVH